MDVMLIEEDRYRVVSEWKSNADHVYNLDDSTWSEVRRWYHGGEFVIYCMKHKSESCRCVEAVKKFRLDCFLDSDNVKE